VSFLKIVERHLGRGLGHKWLEMPVDERVLSYPKSSAIKNYVVPAQAGIQVRGCIAVLVNFCFASSDRAGGCPAATHFLCFAKESKQRKATRVHRFCRDKACDKNPLRYSKRQAAAELLGRIALVSDARNAASSSDSPRGMPLSLRGISVGQRLGVCLGFREACFTPRKRHAPTSAYAICKMGSNA